MSSSTVFALPFSWLPCATEPTTNQQRNITVRFAAVVAALLVAAAWPPAFDGLAKEEQHRQLAPMPLDFRTVQMKEKYHEISHNEDRICIAVVDDASVLSVAVIHESGHLDVALPEGHKTSAAVPCTRYADHPNGPASEEYKTALIHKQLYHCDTKSFRPGYYNKQLLTWHDACTGMATKTTGRSPYAGKALLSADACPISDQRKDLWVSFVGDSVHRRFFLSLGRRAGNQMSFSTRFRWRSGRNEKNPDFFLYRIGWFGHRVWLSFTYNYLAPSSLSDAWQLPYTWGDFVRERKSGPHRSDPLWTDEKVPDIVFYSPGYHASKLNATVYGTGLEGVLNTWQETIEGLGATMPVMHLMLNMMPAPWLIPQENTWDRDYRTLLNEYRKNLAIITVAKKFDFVLSVVDVFSIELPFNGHPGLTAHQSAVRVSDKRVLRIAGDRILDTLCRTF